MMKQNLTNEIQISLYRIRSKMSTGCPRESTLTYFRRVHSQTDGIPSKSTAMHQAKTLLLDAHVFLFRKPSYLAPNIM